MGSCPFGPILVSGFGRLALGTCHLSYLFRFGYHFGVMGNRSGDHARLMLRVGFWLPFVVRRAIWTASGSQ